MLVSGGARFFIKNVLYYPLIKQSKLKDVANASLAKSLDKPKEQAAPKREFFNFDALEKENCCILFARLLLIPYIQYKRRFKMCSINIKDNDEKPWIGKRSVLYRRLWKIRDILPGAFSTRNALCGKANCICRREGKRHRVNQYSYKIGEKQVTKSIPNEYARQVQRQVLANKEFKKILKRIYEVNLGILFEQLAKHKKQKKEVRSNHGS